jgi:hypothetical protein
METLFQEIERALQAQLYYLALIAALSVPEICAALESPTGDTAGRSGQAYKNWYNANLAARLSWLKDVDCYSLRCGVVHQGRFGNPNMQYGRAIFVLPGGNVFSNCVFNDAYVFSVVEFCRTIVDAARQWFSAHHNDANVQANLPRLVQYHASGIRPYIGGVAVIG